MLFSALLIAITTKLQAPVIQCNIIHAITSLLPGSHYSVYSSVSSQLLHRFLLFGVYYSVSSQLRYMLVLFNALISAITTTLQTRVIQYTHQCHITAMLQAHVIHHIFAIGSRQSVHSSVSSQQYKVMPDIFGIVSLGLLSVSFACL